MVKGEWFKAAELLDSRFKIHDSGLMDQETRWLTRYNEVKSFIETNHRNPSKYRLEEHDMLNWIKANRKKMNAGAMPEDRVGKFKGLLELSEKWKRVNQYKGVEE